jgi:hypothetical protein
MTQPGIRQLEDRPGDGEPVERQHVYRVRLRMWLNKGEPVRWEHPWGLIDRALLEDDGVTLVTDLRIDREHLIAGLFQGIEGMRIGGRRKLKISPHLAYGDNGIPGRIPANAVILAEIEIIDERETGIHDE